MAKKRAREADGSTRASDKMAVDGDDSSDEDDFDIVNVDFEWFNFDSQIDFMGTKSLLRQLLDVDATLLDVSGLADLIVAQNTIGSTVKVDGKETDAYAMLTVLNLREHQEKKAVADLKTYLAKKAKATESLNPVSAALTSGQHVGLILSERLINMPSEIAPPMYTMLIDEVEAAVEDKEPYDFTHYLILSKTYNEVESTLDVEERKKKKGKKDPELFYFHPEDEVLQKHALAYGSYEFTKHSEAVADSKRAFQEMGVMPRGSMMLIEASKLPGAVKAMSEYLSPPS